MSLRAHTALMRKLSPVYSQMCLDPQHKSCNVEKLHLVARSQSHLGALFVIEMPEFDRPVLEALRKPLEDSIVTIAHASGTMTFPAQCILIGAMNPCLCGFKGLPEEKCVSSPTVCARYASKLSGPLMDRIDLHIDVPRLKPNGLIGAAEGESSASIRERVIAARDRERSRLGNDRVNAKMTPSWSPYGF